MAATYEPIASQTLSSTQTSITFNSIPATYTDLRVVLVGWASGTLTPNCQFNSDTATNYSFVPMYGQGTASGTYTAINQSSINLSPRGTMSSLSSLQHMFTMDIFSYANANIYKTLLVTSATENGTNGTAENSVQMWRSTAAINSLRVFVSGGGNFNSNTTTITIYGIKAA